jgi:glycosyltransferase involved in cell wall biosynthesis
MVLGIDALSLSEYGGFQHILKLLSYPEIIEKHGFKKVVVWGNNNLCEEISSSNLLEINRIKKNDLISRLYWQKFQLNKVAKNKCDIIFSPGGIYLSKHRPYVTMFQNLLVFDKDQIKQEGLTFLRFKIWLLTFFQSYTFKNSDGLIYISENAKDYLLKNYVNVVNRLNSKTIPLGVDSNFDITKRIFKNYTKEKSFKLLYVSTIKSYKHQWNLIDAVSILINNGYNVTLDLLGGGDKKFIKKVYRSIERLGKNKNKVHFHGKVDQKIVKQFYESSDLLVYPSSCENCPSIVLEAMSYGLPIASSNLRPMTDIMENSALYFDHSNINSIAQTIEQLINDIELRKKISISLYHKSRDYSWELCADRTFSYISKIAKQYNTKTK